MNLKPYTTEVLTNNYHKLAAELTGDLNGAESMTRKYELMTAIVRELENRGVKPWKKGGK